MSAQIGTTAGAKTTLTLSDTPTVALIGIDGGLAAFGVAVAVVSSIGAVFIRVEVWRTKPSSKRLRLRKCDATAERVRSLAGCLHQLIAEVRPVALAIEAVALPFGRTRVSTVSALGRVRGIVDALAEVHQLPVLEETPQRLKLAAAGVVNATKQAVRDALEATYPELGAMWPAAALVEHAADAVASVHACARADVVLAALRAKGGP